MTTGTGGTGLVLRRTTANSRRTDRLFAWALQVLRDLGIVRAINDATTIEQLSSITLDLNSADIMLAIRDALHPETGKRADHFVGLNEGSLKRILNNRLRDLKKDRNEALHRGRHGRRQREADWSTDLILNDDGSIKPVLANLILILSKGPKWRQVLAFDEFNHRVVIKGRPPWGEEPSDATLSDHHEAMVRVWFQRDAKINPSLGDVGRAVQAAAKAFRFHPVRSYFDALVWDGVARLDTWLTTYFHAEDSPYIRAIGPRWLMSGVARIYKPGCQVDHCLVLEGSQGKYKSEALRTLAIRDDWFTDRLSNLASKDAMLEVGGVLIIEFSEMDALSRASAATQKSFITQRYNKFRPPYGKHQINLPRQCIFAATINPPVGGYLIDPTGARRFWPVACVGRVDRAGLKRDRDQLWAEAIVRYKAGNPWWLETPELEQLATAEQAARYKTDVLHEPVSTWLGDRTSVTVWAVVQGVLGVRRRDCPHTTVIRIAKILTSLGFRHSQARRAGEREHRYVRDPVARVPEEARATRATRATPTTTSSRPSRPRIRRNR
jgi:predicted P-loop ATPase